jgi:hypothetical protein
LNVQDSSLARCAHEQGGEKSAEDEFAECEGALGAGVVGDDEVERAGDAVLDTGPRAAL